MMLSRFPMGGGKELKYASGSVAISGTSTTISVTGLDFTPIVVTTRAGGTSYDGLSWGIKMPDQGVDVSRYTFVSSKGSASFTPTEGGFKIFARYEDATSCQWYAIGY